MRPLHDNVSHRELCAMNVMAVFYPIRLDAH